MQKFSESGGAYWLRCYLSVGPEGAGLAMPLITFDRFTGPWTLIDEIEANFMEKIRNDEAPE
jgi:hypothetical protein